MQHHLNAQQQADNDKYLSAALNLLRIRLFRLAEKRRMDNSSANPAVDSEFTEAIAAVRSAAAIKPQIIRLGHQFGLSPFEFEVLLLCIAMELDTRFAQLCAEASGDPQQRYPTFALAVALFDRPAWEVLSPDRPLRRWHLINFERLQGRALAASPLRADERIVSYVKGLNYLDNRLRPLLTAVRVQEMERLPPSQQAHVDGIVNQLLNLPNGESFPLVQLLGADTVSKRLIAWHAATALDMELYHLPIELLPTRADELDEFARLWQREGMLMSLALYIDQAQLDEAESRNRMVDALPRFVERSGGLIFVDSYDVQPALGQATLDLDVQKPTPSEQREAWLNELGGAAPETIGLLTGQFNLTVATIHEVAVDVLAHASEEDIGQQLWNACLLRTRPQLDTLAQRLDVKATWNDIVLSDEAIGLLHEVANQVRQRDKVYEEWGFRKRMNRGFGITVLFGGESGTGKTMAAEVLANDLNLNLYRIDLSSVVSKYIGETEKNLRSLFDAAEDGGAILFFDEADALFGKRSQVRDSHDRYANIEVNYLLQRLEAFRGLAILATNMKSSLDDAFRRRIRFMFTFPFPDRNSRRRIWERIFPQSTPLDNLDYDALARHKLAGGSIFNCALNAAFLAAQAGTPVTMQFVLDAIRTEYFKADRLIDESRFVWNERSR